MDLSTDEILDAFEKATKSVPDLKYVIRMLSKVPVEKDGSQFRTEYKLVLNTQAFLKINMAIARYKTLYPKDPVQLAIPFALVDIEIPNTKWSAYYEWQPVVKTKEFRLFHN